MVKCEDCGDNCDGPTNTTTDCSDDNQDNLVYRAEIYRLNSFSDWPLQDIVRKEVLAKNGFYYLGNRDRVRCAFCNIVLSSWQVGDDVAQEHQRHSKNCPFVVGRSTNNIPYSPSQGSLNSEPPEFPQYKDYVARLETYSRYWPVALKQRPKELAAAGLFYTEKGDAVRCFQCGGMIRNWEENDKPWSEHAKWFPRCLFIRENNQMSPMRASLHKEFRQKRIRKVSLGYDEELVRMFENDRREIGLPECEDEDTFVTEIEKFKIQQNTESPPMCNISISSQEPHQTSTGIQWNLANQASGSTLDFAGYDEVDFGKSSCISCNNNNKIARHTLQPCQCPCCDQCVLNIELCPSCKEKVRAAASLPKF